MFIFGKSNKHNIAYNHLKNTGFLDSDFRHFRIKEIVN